MSVAIPGSIILKLVSYFAFSPRFLCSILVYSALTPEFQTLLAGQIARALAVFCVDEIVVFDDGTPSKEQGNDQEHRYTGYSNPNYFLTHILAYLETPPHLRTALFPMHPDLRLAGALPSLDMPHHLRIDDWCEYREGVITQADGKKKKGSSGFAKDGDKRSRGMTAVDTGLRQPVYIRDEVAPKTRLTVKFENSDSDFNQTNHEIIATVVTPSAPREEAGYYWGYSTRSASSLSTVLTECPFDGGYDLTIGTSERGIPLHDINSEKQAAPEFRHMMVVFGGVAGLEVAVRADDELQNLGVKSPEALFDRWVNLCPGQGSRTIRTEEAVWLGLMGLRDLVLRKGKK